MKKSLLVWAMILMFITTASGVALSKEIKLSGKITSVDGDKITVEISKGNASKVGIGSSVELEVKQQKKAKKAPKAGNDMLQGC